MPLKSTVYLFAVFSIVALYQKRSSSISIQDSRGFSPCVCTGSLLLSKDMQVNCRFEQVLLYAQTEGTKVN